MSFYNFEEPFISRIKDRKLLNKGSTKETYLITLDIENSNIQYEPGDSVAILPQNDPGIVDLTIKYMKTAPDVKIKDPKTDKMYEIQDFLKNKANITKPTLKFLKLFLKNPSIEDSKEYLSYHVWDILKKFSNHKIHPQDICNTLTPLLPRLYSAASSLRMYPNEIHLTVTHVSYDILNVKRNGVCTEFVCHTADLFKTPIPIYIEPSHDFTLPKDKEKPIIMIAAGCGISPFRCFMEERYLDNTEGLNWLFFGERNRKTDFYFENFFQDLVDKNLLRLTTAFSRDQEEKIYVQDKLLENRSDIWQWLQNGASLYVCGDAKMAKGVDETLKLIFIEEGNLNPSEAAKYLKKLTKEKSYLKDVY